MPDNRNNKGYYRPEQDRRPQGQNRPQQQESSTWLTPTVKGIIAILLTVLVVAIVIMIFAKTLFVNTNTTPKKTGTITSTEYIPPKTSSSENLLTIPSGATCKYYLNENGWYYVEYNGTKGYAWQTFFSTPPQ